MSGLLATLLEMLYTCNDQSDIHTETWRVLEQAPCLNLFLKYALACLYMSRRSKQLKTWLLDNGSIDFTSNMMLVLPALRKSLRQLIFI